MSCTQGILGNLYQDEKGNWYLDSGCTVSALDPDYMTDSELEDLNAERWFNSFDSYKAAYEAAQKRKKNLLYFLIAAALVLGYFFFIRKK